MSQTVKCVACAGKGFRWARGRTGEGHMVKRKCPVCKGAGVPESKEGKSK